MRILVRDSELYQTIADMARFLEAGASKEDYSFLDGGTTLEIYSCLLNQCRTSAEWLTLETRYESVGGHVYCPDDNEWEIMHDDPQGSVLEHAVSLLRQWAD
jgi:hypothetical protein